MDRSGAVLREGAAPTTPADIIAFLRGDRLRHARVGLEACGRAAWLYAGLVKPRLPVTCINPVHPHGVLKAQSL